MDGPIDILLLDSDPALRVQALDHFWPCFGPNAVVMLHDVCTNKWHKPLREQLALRAGSDFVFALSHLLMRDCLGGLRHRWQRFACQSPFHEACEEIRKGPDILADTRFF